MTLHSKPAPSPDPRTLPEPLTFFLTSEERRRVLEKLRRLGPNRREALLTLVSGRRVR